MGLLTNRVEKSEIRPGDHIYTYRAAFAYSHHGIYVGGGKVVHFTPRAKTGLSKNSGSDMYDSISSTSSCPIPDCGFSQPESEAVLVCLDCFTCKGTLYCFKYGVTPSAFIAKVRGGACTIAECNPPDVAVHRAMYLLQNGFGNYNVIRNNCEDFALYCKTGLVIVDRHGVGSSGQAASFHAASVLGVPLAALLASPLKMLIKSSVGVAMATAGMYCLSRYATDIGVRTDVDKVAPSERIRLLPDFDSEE